MNNTEDADDPVDSDGKLFNPHDLGVAFQKGLRGVVHKLHEITRLGSFSSLECITLVFNETNVQIVPIQS